MLVLASGILFLLIEANSPLSNIACGRLGRGCYAAQAALLVLIAHAALYSGVPIGQNLRSIYAGYGPYLAGSLLAVSAWLYWGSQVSTVPADIPSASCDPAIPTWLGGLWSPNGALAQDCKQFSGSGTNLPAPAIKFLGTKELRVTAIT